jgi:hypothetical protein
MADVDEPSSAAAKAEKKGGSQFKRLFGWLKLVKSHASQPEATRASVSPASGAHDTGPVNDEELGKLMALGKYVRRQLSTIHDNSTSLQAAMAPRIRVDTLL